MNNGMLSGACVAASIAAPERIRSFHTRCKGCACSCHDDWNLPRCTECLEVLPAADVAIPTARCSDRPACAFRVEKLLIERAPDYVRASRKQVKTQTVKRYTAVADRTRTGQCHHCGAPTKGGQFAPGHDAKLKGDLNREVAEGSQEGRKAAAVEMALRNWASIKKLDRWPADWLELIEQYRVDEGARMVFLCQRNEQRWLAVDWKPSE